MAMLPRTIISVDFTKSAQNQIRPIFHNRWHPDIPPVVQVKQNEVFRVECVDWSGGQIKNDDNAIDLTTADLSVGHILSGPIGVDGAEPGDILEVEILDVQPLPGREWGYTAIFDNAHGGGGFLGDHFSTPHKAIWNFDGIYASSRHIPGVKFVGLIHPGVIACAPSKELLDVWNHREAELVKTDPNRIPQLDYGPYAKGAMVGSLEGTPAGEKVKAEGARTVPPREHGGNCDIKNLSRGSKVWFPVYVKGANLSMGDIHFSQGDGEIAFCGGIEMAGVLTLRVKVIKNGVSLHAMKNPIFLPGPVEPRYTNYITFEGISVDDNGKQHFLDASLSYKQAVWNCIKYFKKFGYTEEQIYLFLSAAPCEGRIYSIVDVPNACCTIGVPTEIFNFDVLPKEGGHKGVPMGQVATVHK